MKQVYQKIGYWSGVVAVSAVLAMTLHYVGAWVEPSTTPPSSNVGAPINTGSSGQYKAGALGVGGVLKAYGNVVIGSALLPNNAKGAEGYLTVKDVYLQDVGKWASQAGRATITCPCGACWSTRETKFYTASDANITTIYTNVEMCTPNGFVKTGVNTSSHKNISR